LFESANCNTCWPESIKSVSICHWSRVGGGGGGGGQLLGWAALAGFEPLTVCLAPSAGRSVLAANPQKGVITGAAKNNGSSGTIEAKSLSADWKFKTASERASGLTGPQSKGGPLFELRRQSCPS